jgi:nucleoside-diphosphate-sugar epimerase
MKIAIRGSTGFLGSWITRILAQEHEVSAVLRHRSSVNNLQNIPNLNIVYADDVEFRKLISECNPDAVILADWWGVQNQFRNDPRQEENTTRATLIAKAAVEAGVKILIGMGSQAEIGPVRSEILDDSEDNPTTLYGKAKVNTRLSIESILGESASRFVWMRVFSTYGPLDTGNWLIPNTVDSLLLGETMSLTKGEQEWSYLHAFDLANAFSIALGDASLMGTVNVGNPLTTSVKSVVEKISSLLNSESLLDFGAIPYRSDQVMILKPRCEKLLSSGWKPQIPLDQGLSQTVDWLSRKPLQPIECFNGTILDFKLPKRL